METQQSDNLLLPQEVLLSAGVHIGTRVKTTDMQKFIYKVRPDGLFVLDMEKMNDRIITAAKFISRMDLTRVVVASSKRYGRLPVHKFCEATGARPLIGRFTSGTFTNPTYAHYFEPEAVIVTDALADQQIVVEAAAIGVPVIYTIISWIYFSYFAYTSPLTTSLGFVLFAGLMDVFVVSLLIEKNFDMFKSILGFWLPIALMFGSSFLLGSLILGQ